MAVLHGEKTSQGSSTPPQPASTEDKTTTENSGAGLLKDIEQIIRNRTQPKIQEPPQPAAAPRHTSSLDERTAAYRRWLQGQSKEDLIEMIVGLEGREATNEVTRTVTQTLARLAGAEPPTEPPIPGDLPYMRLPAIRRANAQEVLPTWWIVLAALNFGHKLIGLQIDSEITIGRAVSGATPDLDLSPYGANTSGVSRYHACIRPTAASLLLIDNDSSNGTFLNHNRLETQTEQPIKEGDLITIGRMSFLVRMLKPPATREAKTLL